MSRSSVFSSLASQEVTAAEFDQLDKTGTGFGSIVLTPGTVPTSTEGAIYYDSSADSLKVYNGTAWAAVSPAVDYDVVFPFTSTAQNIGKLRIEQGIGTFDSTSDNLTAYSAYMGYYNALTINYTGFASAPKIYWSTYDYVYHDLVHAGTSDPSTTSVILRISSPRAATVHGIKVAWIAIGTAS